MKKNGNLRREIDRLLSVDDLAGVLQVPAKTVYEWRSRGEGPPGIRVGRYLRFDPADVAEWLDARKSRPAGLRG